MKRPKRSEADTERAIGAFRKALEIKPDYARAALELTFALVGTGGENIVARMELGASLPAVFVDRVQIQQVVVNLVRNAVDAMAASARRKLTITSALDRDGHVVVAVTDTGTGLSEEVVERLFQPFVTTKADGIGIGLSLSLTIIKAHGGRLWAEPNPGGGTVFSFNLPPEHDGGVDHIA